MCVVLGTQCTVHLSQMFVRKTRCSSCTWQAHCEIFDSFLV